MGEWEVRGAVSKQSVQRRSVSKIKRPLVFEQGTFCFLNTSNNREA